MTEQASTRWGRILGHVHLAVTTGILIGLVDGWTSAQALEISPLGGALLGAGLMAVVCILFGAIQGVLVLGGRWVLSRFGWFDRWRAMTDRDREADREPVIQFHTWLLSVLILGALLIAGFYVFMLVSESVKEASLRTILVVMAAGGAIGGMALAQVLLQPIIRPLIRRLDQSIGLPFPKWPWLRYLLYVVLPISGALVPMYSVYGVKLGIIAPLFALCLFVVWQGGVYASLRPVIRRLSPRGTRGHRIALILWSVVILGAATGVTLGYDRWAPSSQVVANGAVLPHVNDLLRTLSDVDGDGVSSLYGGRDCGPFDSGRHPMAKEVPGNGIDEDCDGLDVIPEMVGGDLTTYLDRLPEEKKKRFNVLILVVDSLRADHVSGYGYAKKTTPQLDALGKDSWVFTRAYSQSSTTALSMPSMHTGRRPASMEWVPGYPQPAHPERMLPVVLGDKGYLTTLSINRYVKRFLKGLQKGFQTVRTVPKGTDWQSGPYIISNIISAVGEAQSAKKPFFITAHLDDAHHPYRSFKGHSVPRFPHKNKDIAKYDRSIAHTDNLLSPLFAHLKHTGAWDDTIVIVTSDHGEEFGEHGGTIHSRSCYVESVHVPLIIKMPGFDPARIDQPVSLIDLVPTLVEVLDIPREGFELDGQSLFIPVLAPDERPKDRAIYCSIFQLLRGRKNFFMRSIRTNHHSLIYESYSDSVELYDTVNDPGEQTNIAASEKALTDQLLNTLKRSLTGNLWEARRFK